MTSLEYITKLISELSFPNYIYIQAAPSNTENQNVVITIHRFNTEIIITVDHDDPSEEETQYKDSSIGKTIKKIKSILKKHNLNIVCLYHLFEGGRQWDNFLVDIFDDQNELTFSFSVYYNPNDHQELLVRSYYHIDNINLHFLLRDFSIIINMLKNKGIKYSILGESPYLYARRRKIKQLRQPLM